MQLIPSTDREAVAVWISRSTLTASEQRTKAANCCTSNRWPTNYDNNYCILSMTLSLVLLLAGAVHGLQWFYGQVVLLVEMLELDGGFEPSLEMMVDFLEEFLICEFEGIDLCGLMIVLLHNTVYLTICVLL